MPFMLFAVVLSSGEPLCDGAAATTVTAAAVPRAVPLAPRMDSAASRRSRVACRSFHTVS